MYSYIYIYTYVFSCECHTVINFTPKVILLDKQLSLLYTRENKRSDSVNNRAGLCSSCLHEDFMFVETIVYCSYNHAIFGVRT